MSVAHRRSSRLEWYRFRLDCNSVDGSPRPPHVTADLFVVAIVLVLGWIRFEDFLGRFSFDQFEEARIAGQVDWIRSLLVDVLHRIGLSGRSVGDDRQRFDFDGGGAWSGW